MSRKNAVIGPGKAAAACARRRGVAFIWTILVFMLFVGFCGLAVDYGYVYTVSQELQSAAEAAALTGVQYLSGDPNALKTAVANAAAQNKAAGSAVVLQSSDIVVGRWDTSTDAFTATSVNPNAVKVIARRTPGVGAGGVPLFFGYIFGTNSVTVARAAVATLSGGGQSTGGLIILSPDKSSAFSLTGNTNVLVDGGDILINSSAAIATSLTGNSTITADNFNIVGGYKFVGNVHVNSDVHTGVTPTPDPLAGLAPPPWSPSNNLGTINVSGNQTLSLNPGYYSGGISCSGNTNLTLRPGIYVLDGAGLNLTGNSSLSALGVMIYLKGTGRLSLTGNGSTVLTPLDHSQSQTYEGISVFQDPGDTQQASIVGNSSMNLDGSIYLPHADASLTGNSSVGFVGAQLIANSVKVVGNGTVRVNFSGGHKANPGGPPVSTLVQ